MNPLNLEWGAATPELIAYDSSCAVHVINHALTDEAQLNRNLAFIRGRVAFFERHLPMGATQRIIFDDRGQSIASCIREALREAITPIASFEYMTERK